MYDELYLMAITVVGGMSLGRLHVAGSDAAHVRAESSRADALKGLVP